MPRSFEEVEKAKYKYQSIIYFPFGIEPGSSFVLTSNPWAYLKAWIDKEISSRSLRGENKIRYTKAKYFAEQAENFEIASNKSNFPIKATLSYYSMLNLIKSYLSTKGLDLEKKEESHGVSLTTNDYELGIFGRLNNCTNIFYEFCQALEKPILGKDIIKLDQIIYDIPEIHELSYSLELINKRKFLPIEIDILTNKEHTYLFTEISYKKENDYRLPIEKFLKNGREKYFKLKEENLNGKVIYRSIKKKKFDKNNIHTIYKNICNELRKFDINLILTRDGYKYYVNLIPNRYHQLANVVLLMFYMGTTARYRPTITKEIMTGNYYPIMTEAVETCPTQFLYQMVSLITGSACVVPKSKL